MPGKCGKQEILFAQCQMFQAKHEALNYFLISHP